MEFKIITDLSALPQVIETNADELKAWLGEKMEHYNTIVVTQETIQSAKDDKAALNKLRTALEDRRKEVKRQCMAPYEAFEKKYKELLALIDAPITSIDTQVKAFEDQALAEKKQRLEDYFENCMASSLQMPVKVEFDRILNPKWKNKTMKESTLQQEIYDTLCRIRDDVQEIHSYYADSPHLTAVLNCYMQGYDKGCALAYAAALIQQEQRQRAAQPPVREPEPTPPPVYEPSPAPPAQEPSEPATQDEPRITGTFRVTGTMEQIIALRDFMRANQIAFQVVK